MNRQKCPRCLQLITSDDTIAFDGNLIVHLDCQRPRGLNYEERALLFIFCWHHIVAECCQCHRGFRQQELAADMFGSRSHLCPTCRKDLTTNLRSHLYACALVPANVRSRAEAARQAACRLVKKSQQECDRADVLMREAEAAIAALRQAMQNVTRG